MELESDQLKDAATATATEIEIQIDRDIDTKLPRDRQFGKFTFSELYTKLFRSSSCFAVFFFLFLRICRCLSSYVFFFSVCSQVNEKLNSHAGKTQENI